MKEQFNAKNNVFDGIYLLVVACLILVATYGCREKEIPPEDRNSPYSSLNEVNASSDKVVALVRSIVMKQGQRLSEEEKEVVLQSVPKTAR